MSEETRPFAVGDKVILTYWRTNHKPDEGTVVKLGRKWATVKGERYGEWMIDIKTGYGKEERGGFGSEYRGRHPEDYEADLARKVIREDIMKLTRNPTWTDKFSTAQLTHLRAILARPAYGEWVTDGSM